MGRKLKDGISHLVARDLLTHCVARALPREGPKSQACAASRCPNESGLSMGLCSQHRNITHSLCISGQKNSALDLNLPHPKALDATPRV